MNTLGPDIDSHFNSIVVMWGLAGVDVYRTYKDAAALTFAEAAWERATQWYITPDEASQGSHPKVIRPIAERCFNGSTEGGVLWILNNSNVTAITTETVAAYVALSALLYEVTSDIKYAANAELSAQFVLDNLYNGTPVENSMDAGSCARTEASEIHSYNSGLYILGLSVLASQNATWTPVLHSVIASTVPFAAWTSETGISIEGQAQDVVVNNHPVSLKGVFVRGLYEAWNRSTSTSGDMNNYIKSWITVQYNALLNLASSGDHYSLLWQGPPINKVLPWCQLNALDVLSTRIGFSHNETSLSTASASLGPTAAPQPTETNSGDRSRTHSISGPNIGAIVGGVIGGVAFLGVVSLLAWWVGRRRRGKQAAALNPTPLPFESSHAAYEIKPFVIPPRNEYISPAELSPSVNPLTYNPAQSTTMQSNSALIISPQTEKNSGETHLEREPRPSGPIRPVVPDASSPAVSAHVATSLTRATAGSMDGAARSVDTVSPQEPPQDEALDPAAVPRLINLLNRIMERYQPEEAPPRYDEV